MKRLQHHVFDGQRTRRDARSRVSGCAVSVAMAHVGVVAITGTLVTAKINPRWVSGGLPREGNQ